MRAAGAARLSDGSEEGRVFNVIGVTASLSGVGPFSLSWYMGYYYYMSIGTVSADNIEYQGVKEVANRTANSVRIASLSTTALITFLAVVRTIVPLVDPHYAYLSWRDFSLFIVSFGALFWGVEYYTYRSMSFGSITTNTNFAYQNFADFLLSGSHVVGGSTYRRLDRAIGRVSLSKDGIDGFIRIPWSAVRSVLIDRNEITIFRKNTSVILDKLLGTSAVLLEFPEADTATGFYQNANVFLNNHETEC
jgi:hypothetical protein